MKITLQQLYKLNACPEQIALFQSLFGKEVAVTETLCLEHCDKFDWNWAADYFLPPAARAEYNRVRAAAWVEYDRVTDAARVEYDRVRAAARAEYERVRAAALAEYDRVKAAAFGRLAERN